MYQRRVDDVDVDRNMGTHPARPPGSNLVLARLRGLVASLMGPVSSVGVLSLHFMIHGFNGGGTKAGDEILH